MSGPCSARGTIQDGRSLSQSGFPASLQIAIHRRGACDAERAGRSARRRVVGCELDRAAPVGKMDGKDRNQKHHDHRHSSDGRKGTREDQSPPTISTMIVAKPSRSANSTPMACRIAMNPSAPRESFA